MIKDNIRHIKEFYKPHEAQEDLMYDAVLIMAKNISANHFNYNKRHMEKKEVDKLIKHMYNTFITENNLDNGRDYTS